MGKMHQNAGTNLGHLTGHTSLSEGKQNISKPMVLPIFPNDKPRMLAKSRYGTVQATIAAKLDF